MNDTTVPINDFTPVYIRQMLPKCPKCGSTRLRSNRSEMVCSRRVKHSRCLSCGQKIRIIVE